MAFMTGTSTTSRATKWYEDLWQSVDTKDHDTLWHGIDRNIHRHKCRITADGCTWNTKSNLCDACEAPARPSPNFAQVRAPWIFLSLKYHDWNKEGSQVKRFEDALLAHGPNKHSMSHQTATLGRNCISSPAPLVIHTPKSNRSDPSPQAGWTR
jgi:hypothetical protein